MRRRTPIRIRKGKLYVWAKVGTTSGLPYFVLMPPQQAIAEKRIILAWPYKNAHVTKMETPNF